MSGGFSFLESRRNSRTGDGEIDYVKRLRRGDESRLQRGPPKSFATVCGVLILPRRAFRGETVHAVAGTGPQVAVRIEAETIRQTIIDGAEDRTAGDPFAAIHNVEDADVARCVLVTWL